MGKNRNQNGRQQGAQDHAVGEHGPVTRAAIRAQLNSPGAADQAAERKRERYDPADIRKHDKRGGDRLFEGRRQHDDAEENSEKTRLARDIDRHKHGPRTPAARAAREASAKRKN
jgi:hypothetical protein